MLTATILTILCLIFYELYTKKQKKNDCSLIDEIGTVEEPDSIELIKIDKQYTIWKWTTIIVTVIALGIYIIPIIFNLLREV